MTVKTTDIAQQLRTDREEAFEQLYQAAFPQVARLVSSLGGDYEDARDIFQDALTLLYEKAVEGRLDIHSSPAAYVVGIAKQLWRRKHHHNKRLAPLTKMEEQIHIPEDFFNKAEGSKLRLFHFLAAAGRKCMDILQAFYYQRMPLREIAEEFGFSNTRSATVQKHKCLEKVREQARNREIKN